MSKKNDPNVLIIDVESTCWEYPEKPGPNEISEIIEIGIAVVDIRSLNLIENDSIIIKPKTSKISKFCTQLTTLTQKVVDQGMTYEAALAILRNRFNSENRTFISWGDYDRKMFERNCNSFNVKYPFGSRHMNLKNSFTLLHGLDREPGMDAALKILNMDLYGTHHRGIDDARNIANIFIDTVSKFRTGNMIRNII